MILPIFALLGFLFKMFVPTPLGYLGLYRVVIGDFMLNDVRSDDDEVYMHRVVIGKPL